MRLAIWILILTVGHGVVAEATMAGNACSGSGFTVDPTDCSIFYQCANGQYVQFRCAAGLNFNTKTNVCDHDYNAPCDAQAGSTTTTAKTTTTATTTGTTFHSTSTTNQVDTTTTSPASSALVSFAEFQAAAATKGGNPDPSYYNGFINSIAKAGIVTRREALLYLSHAVWETVGFKYTKEVYCQTNDCLGAYPNNNGGLPGRVYYGRGMLQLTWDYNYKAASLYLYGNDRLLQNPDVVGDDPQVGWATAGWFWFANVHDRASTFGQTLKAINGRLECEGGTHGQNRYLRFTHYKQILSVCNEPQPDDAEGWCTAY